MAFKVVYSEDSLVDLEEILDYIRRGSPEAARRFGNALLNHVDLNHVDLLASFPYLGAPLGHSPRVRKLLHSPIRVYYQADEEREVVEILHFWHVSRKPLEL